MPVVKQNSLDTIFIPIFEVHLNFYHRSAEAIKNDVEVAIYE